MYGYSRAQELDAEASLQTTPGTDGSGRKVYTSARSIRMVSHDLDSSCTAGYSARSKKNVELDRLTVLVFYCCDIPECKDSIAIRHGLLARRPCV